jgi:signal transduction histidine kinase
MLPQGGLAGVHLSVHADIPADPPQEPRSKPGAPLAQWDLGPSEFMLAPHIGPVSEYFWDPMLGQQPLGTDTQIWQLDCFIPQGQRFLQQQGTIYWLDAFVVTGDGTRYLAFVRSVIVQGNLFCTLQGMLIDWERLRGMLEAEVRDLFPNARLIPVETSTPVTPGTAHNIMQTIPVSLVTGDFAIPAKPGVSVALKVGLAVAWTATILALAAIAYGVMKYMLMMERRMRFVAAVTHELRTPLTTFQLYTDLLTDAVDANEEERRGHVAMLQRESRRLARLVEARRCGSPADVRTATAATRACLARIRGRLSPRDRDALDLHPWSRLAG